MSDPNMTAEKHAYWEGVASQQSKIELLEKELTETQAFLNNQNHIKQAKIDELQARIDGATGYILNNDDIIYVKDEMIWFRDTWWFATFKNNDEIKPL